MKSPIAAEPFEISGLVEHSTIRVTIPVQAHSGILAQWLKRVFDHSLAALALLLLSPILLFIALLVRLESPGPIIYRRRVLGQDGLVFSAFKFRTMYINGHEILARYPKLQEELATTYKLKCDPRVTRTGRLLRKFSLDELPQLFNVLRGEMSLVGPRMITIAELEKYGPWSATLLTARPGLTGLWQVSGRSNTSYPYRVHMDMTYIHNWSFWLDLKILWRTLPAVLKGDGAY